MEAKDHYNNHLANVYAWMIGDFEEKMKEQAAFLRDHGFTPVSNKLAIDLGAGHGLQTIALAQLGYSVKAVDFSKQLLNELCRRKGDLAIDVVEDDIIHFLRKNQFSADVVVCMGDTLTHLVCEDNVEELINEIARHLKINGRVVISFRDLTQPLEGGQRFIPVRSDDSRILTCFLEYFPGHVTVHDILHEKQKGQWVQKVSAYPKLRLDAAKVGQMLVKNGFEISFSSVINRMTYVVATKV